MYKIYIYHICIKYIYIYIPYRYLSIQMLSDLAPSELPTSDLDALHQRNGCRRSPASFIQEATAGNQEPKVEQNGDVGKIIEKW